MRFLKDLLRNLAILIGILIVIYLISPDIMGQVFELYGSLFGPLAILILIIFALPRRRRSR